MSQSPPLLDVRDLCVTFQRSGLSRLRRGAVNAVNGVTFQIHPGQVVGLVGESGSGKSTIGRTILGLQQPSGGIIEFEGRPIPLRSRAAMRQYHTRVQAVYQDPVGSLNPAMTVGQIIEEPLRWLRGETTKTSRVEEVVNLLDQVGLPASFRRRRPSQLSGGQAQRVAVARALAPRPRLIVADEAVSALDVSTQAQIINLFADLRATNGIAILFIAHDLDVVRHISDEVGVLQNGNLVEWGDARRVHDAPAHEYTKSLIAAIPGKQRQRDQQLDQLSNWQPKPMTAPADNGSHAPDKMVRSDD